MTLPDGTAIQGTSLSRPDGDPSPDWGLYLDDRWDPPWPHEFVPWPDFGLPADIPGCDGAITGAFDRARAGERVEVGCLGGIGRTGTVLACMAVLAGVVPSEAVAWVRSHYQPHAVETPGQQQFVIDFGERIGRRHRRR